MAKRIRTIIIIALCLIIGLPVLAFLLVPSHADATPQAKVSEVFLYVSSTRNELEERCTRGALYGGMTHKSLDLPDPYKPGPHVKYVTVQVENPERVLVSAYLEDIYLDILFWKVLHIPASAKIVWQGTCDGKEFKWGLLETTVPNRYLPSYHRAATSAN